MADSDGAFEVAYGRRELTVSADMPGSHLGGEGTIYREVFAGCTCDEVAAEARPDARCPEHGKYACKDIVGGEAEPDSPFRAVSAGPNCWEVRRSGLAEEDRRENPGPLATFHGHRAEAAADTWIAVLEGGRYGADDACEAAVRRFQSNGNR